MDIHQYNLSNPEINNPSYMKLYEFEKVDHIKWLEWLQYLAPLGPLVVITYLILVYLSMKWMKNRAPFNLQKWLVIWNIGMVIASICFFVRGHVETRYVFMNEGLYDLVCTLKHNNGATIVWAYPQVLSKVIQLGDTFFLIFRKKPVTFFHWSEKYYHHLSMLSCILYQVIVHPYDPTNRVIGGIRALEHIFMYSYFAIQAMNFKLPRPIAILLTGFQTLLMTAALFVTFASYNIMRNGIPCRREYVSVYIHLLLAATYLLFFLRLFFNKYFRKRGTDTKMKDM